MTSFDLVARAHRRIGVARLRLISLLLVLGALLVGAPSAQSAVTTQTMFGSARPETTSDSDGNAVELGAKFRVSASGSITGIRYYKSTDNTGPHTGTLWNATGTRLASVTFIGETASGWQTARLATAVNVKPNTTYVVSYHTTTGHYAADAGYFDGHGAGTGSVTALAAGVDGPNGVYRYGAGGFPTSTWRSANYWVDVTFVAGSGTVPTTAATATSTSTPTPTPTPTAATTTTTNSPDPAPASDSLPGPDNTGVPDGTALTSSDGFTASTAGQVIDSRSITGMVTVTAPGVIIRRCRFTGGGQDYAVRVVSGSVRIEDSEIRGNYVTAAVGYDDWTAVRLDVHDVPDDGFKLGSDTLLADSWVHDFTPEPLAHADGVQLQSGVVNATIRHNTIDVAGNAALFIAPDLGPSTSGPVLIEANLLGGGNYTLFNVDGSNGVFLVQNITIRDNRFLRNARFGPVLQNVLSAWTNNTFADNGEIVPP